jgi:divalent metal cation (Fe/Co/Zn/Cd) transporter
VAVLLIREARGLLIGEGIRPETAKAVRKLVLETDGVREAGWPLSMYIGPEEVLLTLDAAFDPKMPAGDVASAVRRIEEKIRQRYPPHQAHLHRVRRDRARQHVTPPAPTFRTM